MENLLFQTDNFGPGSHAYFLVCNTMLALLYLITSANISDYRD